MSSEFEFVEFSITQDEGDPFWRCSVMLANPQDGFLFKPDDRFTLNLLGELYEFFVASVSISKTGPVAITATVEGIGIGALLDTPRASAVTKVWETDISAYDVVSELLDSSIDSWEFINWTIPGNRLSIENGSAVELAKKVVEAAGGILESYPHGPFYVRKKFPLSPLKYSISPIDIELDEMVDVDTVTFNYQNSRYTDWVRIRDIDEAGVSDRVEFKADSDSGLRGTLFVYPQPWRNVHLIHTGPDDLVLLLEGVVERLVPAVDDDLNEQLVEIFEGQGSTKYPIVEIVSIRWQAKDLLGLYFDPYSTTVYSTHPTEKYSLVYVTYKTKSINYHVESSVPQEVQFLVEED